MSCSSNFLLQSQKKLNESLSIERPNVSYQFEELPKKINIIYSNPNDKEAIKFIKGISANYFYYRNLKYIPEIKFIKLQEIKDNECSSQGFFRTYSVIFLNNELHKEISTDCLNKLQELNGLLVLSSSNLISQNPNQVRFNIDQKEDYLDLLNYSKNQGNRDAIIIDDDATKDKEVLAKIWKDLDGRIIKSSTSENKQNEKLLSSLLLIENSTTRAKKLSRTLSTTLEFTPRRRKDIDSLILSVSLSTARSLKPALEYNFGESVSVYLSSAWINNEYYKEKEIDLEGITLIDMPWMLNASSDIKIDMQNRSRNFAIGFDAYELVLLLNNPSTKRNFAYKGLSGKISLYRGKLTRQSLKVNIKKGGYEVLAY